MERKKTSLTLDPDLWNEFQIFSLTKNMNARSASIELEKAIRAYLDENHPKK